MQSINKEGRNNFKICFNFSFVLGAACTLVPSSTLVEGRTFLLLRWGSRTVSNIMKPMTIPGIPAIIKDLEC